MPREPRSGFEMVGLSRNSKGILLIYGKSQIWTKSQTFALVDLGSVQKKGRERYGILPYPDRGGGGCVSPLV